MSETFAPLPKWSEDRRAYAREWVRRKRASDPVFARREAEKARGWQKANPIRNARNQYKQSARRRGYVWALTDQVFAGLVTDGCHYCGWEAVPPGINGVDRVDNQQGYIASNVVTACAQCNLAKKDLPLEDFLAWAERLVVHSRKES